MENRIDRKVHAGLETLKSAIENKDFERLPQGFRLWGGADMIIAEKMTAELQQWHGGQKKIDSLSVGERAKQVLITPYFREVSWLLYQIKEVFAGSFDRFSMSHLYGRIVLAMKAVEKQNPEATAHEMIQSGYELALDFAWNWKRESYRDEEF